MTEAHSSRNSNPRTPKHLPTRIQNPILNTQIKQLEPRPSHKPNLCFRPEIFRNPPLPKLQELPQRPACRFWILCVRRDPRIDRIDANPSFPKSNTAPLPPSAPYPKQA
ncbi:hypothetical protein ACFX16_046973 [Malus domestica]